MSVPKFYCECGMEVSYGSSVEKQIKHINSSYHRRNIKKKLLGTEKEDSMYQKLKQNDMVNSQIASSNHKESGLQSSTLTVETLLSSEIPKKTIVFKQLYPNLNDIITFLKFLRRRR